MLLSEKIVGVYMNMNTVVLFQGIYFERFNESMKISMKISSFTLLYFKYYLCTVKLDAVHLDK